MYYDIEEETREPEPDIDEQLKELQKRKARAEREFRSSEQTDADRKKLDYILLAVAEHENELLEKKIIKNSHGFLVRGNFFLFMGNFN